MLTLKNFLIAVVALSVLLAAIGSLTPSSAQGAKPVQDVSVVNTPAVQAQQSGPWTVGAQLTPGSTVGISGTPTVAISGTPTVNVASLPPVGLDVQPSLPAFPFVSDVSLTNAKSRAVFGEPGTRAIGLTSITLTNFESFSVQVSVIHPILATPDTCDGTVTGGTLPEMYFLVQARSTLHLTYPTPLVFSRVDGASCIKVELGSVLASGNLDVSVNGFRQY